MREGFPGLEGNPMANAKEAANTRPPVNPASAGRGPSLSSIGEYFRGVREELRKAEWPSRPELIRLTQVVLAVIFVVAIYVGSLDALLSWVTTRFLGFGR